MPDSSTGGQPASGYTATWNASTGEQATATTGPLITWTYPPPPPRRPDDPDPDGVLARV